jgi:sec-independent protein translocase protein TatA|tara:strand:+ start:610 stop:795 length:186 start_codon:yes stop_codon:yes gene_type:complete
MIIYILPLAMPGIGSIALIAGALLLLFGGKKIPELMKGIGGGIKEFKKASKEDDAEDEKKS